MRLNNMEVIILSETRISDETTDKIIGALSCHQVCLVDAKRRSDSIWLLTKDNNVQVSVLKIEDCFIHMKFTKGDKRKWPCTAAYVNSKHKMKQEFY